MKLFRIITTTSKGVVFMSPFVYEEKKAEKLVSDISSWHKMPTYEIVEVSKYPRSAICSELDFFTGAYEPKLVQAELNWKRYKEEASEIEEISISE